MTTNELRAWRLRHRPVGEIKDTDLELVTEPIPDLSEGQFLIRVDYLSLDPTQRVWMSDIVQYMPPVALNDIMRGLLTGTVIESRNPKFPKGQRVAGLGGWADHWVSDGTRFAPMPDIPSLSVDQAFGVFSLAGPTAYFGLLDIGQPRPGETVVVSAAAGSVGSLVGQIAKIKGCRVVGIAGGDEKCRWIVDELGFDGAINYKVEDIGKRLDELCPKGIDINFENVGGPIMEEVMQRMNNFSRMPLCGLIASYNAIDPVAGPSTFPLILMRRIKVQGFIASDFADRFGQAYADLGQWMAEGKLKSRTDVRHGLENILNELRALLKGGNIGKMLLKID